MTSKTGKDLENIQYFFLHMVLDAQRTTPKVALLWETGILSMEGQVFKRKLQFINHLKRSEGSLANEIYKEQVANNWPGLSQEDDKYVENRNSKNNKKLVLRKKRPVRIPTITKPLFFE